MLVARLRSGPPMLPWRVPVLRRYLNGLEYFIHHEDVRRANDMSPRKLDTELEALCWQASALLARRLAHRLAPTPLALRTPEGLRRGHETRGGVTLFGQPSELVLYLSGRRSAAQVEERGDEKSLTRLHATSSGL